jgi:high affinity Mn2+ porin
MKHLLPFLIAILCMYGKSHAQQTDTLKNEWFTLHAQTTVINQNKPSFNGAKYTGDNSLHPQKESKTSLTSTFYLGARLWKGASFYVNPEIAGGSGLSEALGVAAAPNGETFRIGDPAPKIYVARLFYHQVFALSKEKAYQSNDFNQLGGREPLKYIALTIGKVGAADYFDDNQYSHDPRSQFMSWALMDNGAWDYPANTRGYTPSVILEYITPHNELRYGFSLMPKTANGNKMNWDVQNASSSSLEYTHRYSLHQQKGAVRVLGFFNTTNMGNYRESIALRAENPVIQDTRKFGHTKFGFAVNAEQELGKDLGAFFRASWNDGNNETWCFTEIDRSISAGLSLGGNRWKRSNDRVGLAFVASGISRPHRDYLMAGGKGFMLGDGNLKYGLEKLAELYYSAELVKNQVFISGAYQLLMNPGYNKDRKGPIHIFSVRVHTVI